MCTRVVVFVAFVAVVANVEIVILVLEEVDKFLSTVHILPP
jgi:hypothetical protein